MKNDSLKDKKGIKIRRQYFTFIIYVIMCFIIGIPYVMTVLSLVDRTFDTSKILFDILTMELLCFAIQLPFIVTAIINRFCFGKIICVLTEQGIYHENGFVYWSDITKIEYEIGFPSKYHKHPCYAYVYTKDEEKTVQLTHAPLHLLSRAKKYVPDIATKISRESKIEIAIFVSIIIGFPLLMLFE